MDDLMEKIQEVLSDEESMKQLNELAASLFSSTENDEDKTDKHTYTEKNQEDSNSGGMDFDIGSFMKLGKIMNSVNSDKNTELLLALKPLLREERRERVDKAVKILKLFAVYNVLKDSGMLEEFF